MISTSVSQRGWRLFDLGLESEERYCESSRPGPRSVDAEILP